MKKLCFAAVCVTLALVSSICRAEDESQTSLPNFVIFLTDDLGWGDLACYGHPRIQTPNLDAFAKTGVRLTQCYAACSVCSPSRSAILTGRTPYRNGVWRWIPPGSEIHLRSSEITISKLLQEKGYHTCHAGKWHLNGKFNSDAQPQPGDHGYDHWLATQNNASPNHLNPTNFVRNGEAVGKMEGPSSHIAVAEAVNWLKNRKDKSAPFLISLWTHEPHLPIESTSEFMEPYADLDDEGLRQHHGNITQLDAAFGKMIAALDELKLRGNTFVMFTSDNGPEGNGTSGRTRGSTGGLRGRKRHTYEGGIRVPGIISWPGHIKPGTEVATPVIGSDIFTTICDVLKDPIPQDRTIDDASMVPLFAGKEIKRDQPLYWRNHLAPDQQKVALRVGDLKIIASDDLSHFELYNIAKDSEETSELSEKLPEEFASLKAQLIKFDAGVLAEGRDWWKNEAKKPQRSKPGQAKPLQEGKDNTGSFDIIKGGVAEKVESGISLQAEGECLALRKLETPITDRATFRVRYRSTLKEARIRNAAFAFGSDPSNEGMIKVGTAIGLNQHVAFSGNWNQLGSLAKTSADFQPLDSFDLEVHVDLKKHTLTATISKVEMKSSLPESLTEIRYLGYYVKGTTSEFGGIEME